MAAKNVSRRQVLLQGGRACAGLGGLLAMQPALVADATLRQEAEVMIPFLDQPPETDPDRRLLDWQHLESWITPNDEFFSVGHYGAPEIDVASWRLGLEGLVNKPRGFSLSDLERRPRAETVFTLECAGNGGFPSFVGGIGNAAWTGTPLASILREAGLKERASEVVFVGTDAGEEEVRGISMKQNFARSMSLEDAMSPHNPLCYEMNGKPLPPANGYPVRLIAPGWYGIANVKWLKRIEVRDTRFMGRFMARDYVTIREERQGGESVWMETSVGRSLLKSMTAKVVRRGELTRIHGAAWGAAIERVEVRIDDGPWLAATIEQSRGDEFSWKFWHLDWRRPAAGEHAIVSRAVDVDGNRQPEAEDPWIANKHTYWESNAQVTRRIRIA